MTNEIYLIETKELNTGLMERIARLKQKASKGDKFKDADAAKRLIKKYGY